jgi:hypothetical protein
MRRLRLPLVAIATLLAIAACSQREPVAEDANAQAEQLPTVNKPSPAPWGGPPESAQPTPAPAQLTPAAAIPKALQGRWGLTPADCMIGRGDAKGLLVVSERELRFYESRAVPTADVQVDADSVSGRFDFTGEGQSWSKYESLKLDERKLIRTETNPNTSYTYARC